MTRRRRLAGHHCTRKPLGPLRGQQRVLEGWAVSCTCGWSDGPLATRQAANEAFTAHVLSAMPICGDCSEPKAPREMSVGSPHLCKKCSTAKTRAWALANPKQWERSLRRSYLKKQYGITPEQYDTMVAAQGGACAICRGKLADSRGFRPHVDHCHETGLVRGVLCGRCNRGLGQFNDDVGLLGSAIDYLVRSMPLAEVS